MARAYLLFAFMLFLSFQGLEAKSITFFKIESTSMNDATFQMGKQTMHLKPIGDKVVTNNFYESFN